MGKLGQAARLIASVLFVASAAGCLSMGTVQTADTLGKRNFQISAEVGPYGFITPQSGTSNPGVLPDFDVAFRYGLTDRFDIGARAGGSLLELQTKFLLTNPQNELLAMSLAPTLGGAVLDSKEPAGTVRFTYFNLALPLLIGIKHFNGNELVFGPRINNMLVARSDIGGGYLFGVGASIGYAFAIGKILKILPEFAFNVPIAVTASTSSGSGAGTGYGGVIYQFKIGLMFSRRKVHAEPEPEPVPIEPGETTQPTPGPPPAVPIPPEENHDVPPPPALPPMPPPSGL